MHARHAIKQNPEMQSVRELLPISLLQLPTQGATHRPQLLLARRVCRQACSPKSVRPCVMLQQKLLTFGGAEITKLPPILAFSWAVRLQRLSGLLITLKLGHEPTKLISELLAFQSPINGQICRDRLHQLRTPWKCMIQKGYSLI